MLTDTEYTQRLIDSANNLLLQKEYEKILSQILVPSHNYRSGWTEDVSQLFHEPSNEEEKLLAEQLAEIIKQTVAGLLETAQATAEIFGYAKLEYIATFLYRLADLAPQDLVLKTKNLLLESQRLGAPELAFITIPALTLLSELEAQKYI